jgi:anti-anti-sigma factor
MSIIEQSPGDGDERLPEPRPGQLDMQVFVAGGEQTVRIAGELDIATQPLLANAIDGMDIEAADVITLDMRRLTFLDSSGLHQILALQESCKRAATELRIIPGPRSVQRVFEVTGVLDSLPFHQS